MSSPVTINYWNWNGSEGEVFAPDADLIGHFHTLHPDIRVERHGAPWASYPWEFQKVLRGPVPPDVMMMSCIWLSPLVEDGLLMNMERLIARDQQNGSWDAHARLDPRQMLFTRWYCGDIQNDLHALPYSTGPGFIIWNKTLFERMGIKTPLVHYREGSWTLEAFVETAEAMSDPPDRWGYLNPTGFWPQKVHLMVQSGATWWDWNRGRFAFASTGGERGLEWELGLSTKRGAAPPTDAKAPGFGSGRIAMTYSIGFRHGLPGALPFEWDVVPCPRWPQTRYVLMWDCNFLVIPQSCRHPDAAWQWVKYLVDEQSLQVMAKRGWGGLPTTMTSPTLETFLRVYPAGTQAILDALPDAWHLNGGFTRHWQRSYADVFGPALRAIYSLSQPVAQALQAAENAMNAILEKA